MDRQTSTDYRERGQVALVMVLIMTVVSAVVVSVAGRVTTETRLQQLSKDSSDAFLVAQSGIDEAINKQQNTSGQVGESGTYNVTLEDRGVDGVLTDSISPGTSLDIILSGSELLQGIKIYWNPVTASESSIFVSKITDSTIVDSGFDANGFNGFTKITTGGVLNGVNFRYVTNTIDLDSTVNKVRLTVYGGVANLGIEPIGDILPVQTIVYNSEGVVGSGGDKVKYGLTYEESKDKRTPEVFDYALFSFGSIIQ